MLALGVSLIALACAVWALVINRRTARRLRALREKLGWPPPERRPP